MPRRAEVAHAFGENRHMMGVNFGCDSVSEVEDMTGAFSETAERFLYLVFNNFRVCQHNGRIKIALQGYAVTHPGPCLGKRDGPVDTQAIAAGIGDCFEM